MHKRILFIIPCKKFCDVEYLSSRQILEALGVRCEVASSTPEPAIGLEGTIVTPDYQINNVRVSEYNAFLLVGGVGCREYWHNKSVHKLLNTAYSSRKLLCAICLAPVTLANAGLLRGMLATAHPAAAEYLKYKGVKYSSKAIEHERNIITANGPEATQQFANKITEILECNKI